MMAVSPLDPPGKQPSRKRNGLFWMLLPVGLLGLSLGGWALMISIAVDDPGFAVEEDYYQKGARWDEHRAQLRQNSELGWNYALDVKPTGDREVHLIFRLTDGLGEPVLGAAGQLEAFAVGRSAHVERISLRETERPGVYEAKIVVAQGGLWELRLTAEKDGQRFTQTMRSDLNRPNAGAVPGPRQGGDP